MTADRDKLLSHLGAVPIFPLPSAVLLPYEVLPLHVFEPRYRQMIAEVLEEDRPLAIAQLAPGWEGDYEGRPRVEPVCGVGLVTRSEKLGDGRYNILVRGVARLRIEGELPPRKLYREVQARLLDDERSARPADEVEAQAESVRRMLFALCASRPGPASNALAQVASKAESSAALADIVAAALVTDTARRQKALLTLDVAARLQLAEAAVTELLVGTPTGGEVRYRN